MTDADCVEELRNHLAWLTDRNSYPTRAKRAIERAIELLEREAAIEAEKKKYREWNAWRRVGGAVDPQGVPLV